MAAGEGAGVATGGEAVGSAPGAVSALEAVSMPGAASVAEAVTVPGAAARSHPGGELCRSEAGSLRAASAPAGDGSWSALRGHGCGGGSITAMRAARHHT